MGDATLTEMLLFVEHVFQRDLERVRDYEVGDLLGSVL